MQRFNCLSAGVATAVLLTILCLGNALAQDQQKPKEAAKPKADGARPEEPEAEVQLSVGDAAPTLRVEKFIKGTPVGEFKPGHVYVVEFWATWCGPCRASMPYLTGLQKKFKDKATFVGINIAEKEYGPETLKKVEDFVKKNDKNMGYTVAFDGAKKEMDKAYMQAADQLGIPCAFVITGDGKIAYIGYPDEEKLEALIQQVIDSKFDMKAAVAAAKAESFS